MRRFCGVLRLRQIASGLSVSDPQFAENLRMTQSRSAILRITAAIRNTPQRNEKF